jgi:hypothetical protein
MLTTFGLDSCDQRICCTAVIGSVFLTYYENIGIYLRKLRMLPTSTQTIHTAKLSFFICMIVLAIEGALVGDA